MRGVLLGTAALVAAAALVPPRTAGQAAPDVTFSKDVAPIFNSRCVSCHRPGEVAPFSLLSFKDARPWAQSIKHQVETGAMPPWKADPHFGEFRDPRTLTDREIATIAAWVNGGAKEGNPADLPRAPRITEGWQIGTPDVVLTMKEPVTIPASGTVPYATYPTDFVLDRDVWVQAIEIRPGNRRVVHHAVAQADLPGVSVGPGGSQNVHLFSPGLEAMVWREGYGKFFPKGTRFSFQMHYNAIGRETTDQSKIGLKFATAPVHTQVNTTIVLNNTLLVPPMVQKHEVIAAFQFPNEARIHALRPHMHLRARLGTASLIQPGGERRVLLHIPDWDDSWQNYYVLARPAPVSKGSILEYLASYDNSPANALNPDPRQPVPWGQQVWDEMHSVYMTWTAVNDRNRTDDEPIQIAPSRLFTGTATARR
ncbi:MAG TPA: cytochrome c [Vicinamibacterales bacterium]|nr:cytochrome c [Vicinamibacterales bacterium]